MSQPASSEGHWIVWSILHPAADWIRVGTYDNIIDAKEMHIWLTKTYPAGTFVISDKSIDPNDVF